MELCETSITITKNGSKFQLAQKNNMLLSGSLINKVMIVTLNQLSAALTEGVNSTTWHQCLGHPGSQVMKLLGLAPLDGTACDICIKGKMTVMPFKGHFNRAGKPLDCLYPDVVGHISPPSISGHCYFLTIVNKHTCFIKSKATYMINLSTK
ncbi:hypothetical protein O181_061873 [Austropuccinia psidii MF-1]|uniref:GAG-pre-integrase domain-containing protein n=1 Tax=Austropuccinia psidii MF-1 TaxID=1389203 RepID=A0A9Q3HYZ8_9BASI|nr:hypothetical protein [Austropuccinia psidii MF-1]